MCAMERKRLRSMAVNATGPASETVKGRTPVLKQRSIFLVTRLDTPLAFSYVKIHAYNVSCEIL